MRAGQLGPAVVLHVYGEEALMIVFSQSTSRSVAADCRDQADNL